MIELAPHHKYGLPLNNPVMIAGGMIGYGEALPAGLEPARLGALVIGPFMQSSRAGAEPPRLAPVNGGVVLQTGLQNRGVNAAVKRFGRLWPDLGCPVIAQIADSQPRMVAAVAERLAAAPGILGVELLLPQHTDIDLTANLVKNAVRHCDLPVLVNLPLSMATDLAQVAVDEGAVALVVAQAPAGAAFTPVRQTLVRGSLFGPLAFAPMLHALAHVAALNLGCSLVASGGIHTVEQARQALAAGATALQIDSAVWVEPGLPGLIAAALEAGEE